MGKITTQSLRATDFFAGIGGNHLSLESAVKSVFPDVTLEVVAAIDLNTNAKRVYEDNFPNTPFHCRDVRDLPQHILRAINSSHIWLMSPPCQPYTRRGAKRDADDRRASGLAQILNHLAEKRLLPPPLIFIENVARFEASRSAADARDALRSLGYTILEFAASPKEVFNAPTARLRVFTIAVRPSDAVGGGMQHPGGVPLPQPPLRVRARVDADAVLGGVAAWTARLQCPRAGVLPAGAVSDDDDDGGDAGDAAGSAPTKRPRAAAAHDASSATHPQPPPPRGDSTSTPHAAGDASVADGECERVSPPGESAADAAASSRAAPADDDDDAPPTVCCYAPDCTARDTAAVAPDSGDAAGSSAYGKALGLTWLTAPITRQAPHPDGAIAPACPARAGCGDESASRAGAPPRGPACVRVHALLPRLPTRLLDYIGVAWNEGHDYPAVALAPQVATKGAYAAHVVAPCTAACVCAAQLIATAPGEPGKPPTADELAAMAVPAAVAARAKVGSTKADSAAAAATPPAAAAAEVDTSNVAEPAPTSAAGGSDGGAPPATPSPPVRVYAVEGACGARAMCLTKAYGRYAAGATVVATRTSVAAVAAAFERVSEGCGGACPDRPTGAACACVGAATWALAHGSGLRWLSPGEAAALLAFPPSFRLRGAAAAPNKSTQPPANATAGGPAADGAKEEGGEGAGGAVGGAAKGKGRGRVESPLTARQQWMLLGNSVHVALGAEVLAIGLAAAFERSE